MRKAFFEYFKMLRCVRFYPLQGIIIAAGGTEKEWFTWSYQENFMAEVNLKPGKSNS